MVPSEAVLQRASGPVVFVVGAGDVVERREVALGPFHRDSVEVVSGVAPGETVVTRGHAGLVDGVVVRVAESVAPTGASESTPPGVASAARPDGSS